MLSRVASQLKTKLSKAIEKVDFRGEDDCIFLALEIHLLFFDRF